MELNLLLTGRFGIGKTYTLNKIAQKHNTIVLSSNPSLSELNIIMNSKFKSKKDAYLNLMNIKRRTIIIDDVHESRKDTISMILKICKVHRVICASEYMIDELRFDFVEIRLKPLNFKESMKLCSNFCKDKNACKKICKESKGIPLLIIRGCEYYNVTGTVKRYFSFDIKKEFLKNVIIIAYLLLSLRYIVRLEYNWKMYSIISTIAYAFLAINRISKRF